MRKPPQVGGFRVVENPNRGRRQLFLGEVGSLTAAGQVVPEARGEVDHRLSPPEYILREMGERPGDSAKAKAWDSGVRRIEAYRHEYGVTDAGSALGREPKGDLDRRAYDRANDAVRDAQRRLERQRQLDRSIQRSQEAGRDMGMGIGH